VKYKVRIESGIAVHGDVTERIDNALVLYEDETPMIVTSDFDMILSAFMFIRDHEPSYANTVAN
jgi:hypothetical protein